MFTGVKTLLAIVFVSGVAVLFSLIFQNADNVKQAKDELVFSAQDILNSDRLPKKQTATADHELKKGNADTNEVNGDETTQTKSNPIQRRPDNTNTPLKNNQAKDTETLDLDNDLDWKLNAMLESELGSNRFTGEGSATLYQDPTLFVNYSFGNGKVVQKDEGKNEKYKSEREYLNILATVLLKHQYENNTERAMKLFSSWFLEKDPKGREQVIKEANDYIKIAEILNNASRVPDSFKGIHYRLARSYKKAGEEMLLLANDMNDDEKLKVLEGYGKAANSVAKAYIAISDMIDLLGLSFDKTEPANLFVFPGSKQEWKPDNI